MLELNPGGDGIRLDKLADISGELEKFLVSLAADSGVSTKASDWVAHDFYNGSMGAIVEYVEPVEEVSLERFNNGFRRLTKFQRSTDQLGNEFRESTYRQFVAIGSRLDTDERVRIGLYDEPTEDAAIPAKPTTWEAIAKRTTIDVEEAVLSPVIYVGSIQGTLSNWFTESNFIYVRDSVFNGLVKCIYKPTMYDLIYRFYENKKSVVHVTGTIKSDRLSGEIEEINVDSIDQYGGLSNDEFDSIFGSAPDIIGEETSGDYLDRERDDGDA